MPKPTGKPASTQKVRVAEQNPTDFTGGGLPTDFDGTIIEARAVVWNYDNGNGPKTDEKTGEVILIPAMRLKIARPNEEDIVSYYSAGDLNNFFPLTEDGDLAVQDENGLAEGVMFGLVGTRERMGKDTNHGQFLAALTDAGFKEAFKPDLRFLEGLNGHFDRLQQKKRAGVVANKEGDDNKRAPEYLAMTKFNGRVDVAAATKAAPKAAAATTKPTGAGTSPAATASSSSGGVDSKLRDLIVASIPASDGDIIGSLKKGGIAGKVMKAGGWSPAEKSAAVKLISSEWLSAWAEEDGAAILFDAEAGEIYANAPTE